MPEIPPFILEPIESAESSETESRIRLRNDSYLGAVHKNHMLIRAGLQVKLEICDCVTFTRENPLTSFFCFRTHYSCL